METHPGIIFRFGPAGWRPGLVGGPDVWEVVRVFRGIDAQEEDAIQKTVLLTGLTPEQVRTAAGYYSDYPAEIDDWLRRVDEEAARAETAWADQQDLRDA